jgi:hypothetical protein
MAMVIKNVDKKNAGKAKNKIKDIHHPLKKAKNNPDMHIAKDMRI